MNLMDTLLEIAAVFITPDWNALLGLIPVLLLVLFVAWFAFTVRKFATLGPSRRAPARIQPVTPEHVHMPGGTPAPILVALGAGGLFFGVVAGGLALWVGAGVLVFTLLWWFREAVRDYDQIEGAQRLSAGAGRLPAVIHQGPPPGVHMPGPSIRPLLGALGTAALLGGLLMGGPVLVLAVVFFVWTLIGWLVDATAEYRKVEEADHTGHLENIPARRLPGRALQVFAVLFAAIAVWQLGVFTPAAPVTGAPGESPGAGPTVPPGTLVVVAFQVAFEQKELQAAPGQPFAVLLRNQDPPGTPHDVDIRTADGAETIKDTPTTDGGQEQLYQYEALEAGTYQFICSIHPIPAMTGTLTVQ
jgi:plastocyanin